MGSAEQKFSDDGLMIFLRFSWKTRFVYASADILGGQGKEKVALEAKPLDQKSLGSDPMKQAPWASAYEVKHEGLNNLPLK